MRRVSDMLKQKLLCWLAFGSLVDEALGFTHSFKGLGRDINMISGILLDLATAFLVSSRCNQGITT